MTHEEAEAHIERARGLITQEVQDLCHTYAELRDPIDRDNFVAAVLAELAEVKLRAVECDTDCRQLLDQRSRLRAQIKQGQG